MRSFIPVLLLAFPCAGCAGTRVSSDVLEVARATMPGGEFHIEFAADGRVVEAGGAIPLEEVPAACRAAVDAAFPGGRQTGAELLVVAKERVWLVAKQIEGRSFEILVEDDGTIFGGEESLAWGDWPPEIVDAARAAVPEAQLERVERVWGKEARGGEAYHVKFSERGESVRVGVSAEGQVVRVVRRMVGQVRVPR